MVSRSTVVGLAACTLLLATYAALAWTAARAESPTFDEPYHALSAWTQLHRHDYRIDNEDPPLWQYWASLPNGPAAISADFDGPLWRDMATRVSNQWAWTVQTLYRTPGNDGAAFVGRCRAMMLAVAVALGVLIAAWAWRLGGPAAGVAATALFALDPNFLAHGPLMKNDVAAALAWLAVAWSLWAVGRRATAGTVGRLIVLAVLPLGVKYSGAGVVALVPAALVLRAWLSEPWPAFGRTLMTRRARLGLAAVLLVAVATAGWVGIWSVYGFRFRSGPNPADRLDIAQLADRAVDNERVVRPASDVGLSVRAALFADRHRLLPEPFVAGFLFTYGQSLVRPSYLFGRTSFTGRWDYFPALMLMKTPTATLLAIGGAVVLAVKVGRCTPDQRWAGVALAAPVAVYMASALSTHLNIGLRHVLPAYPPLFVLAGWGASVALRRSGRGVRTGVGALALTLAGETAAAGLHFIPFVNQPTLAVHGQRLDLFGNSNLDWGQDLPLLAQWRHEHPAEPFYLAYFGLADPHAYGLDYTALPGGYGYDSNRRFPTPDRPCWLAVSATILQADELTDPRLQSYYARLAADPPAAVLGQSIYIYHYDPVEAYRRRRSNAR